MQTDYPTQLERAHRHIDADVASETDTPVSISHFVHVLQRYSQVIVLLLVAIALAYLIVATGMILFSSSQRTTAQPFRLNFEGAEKGEYPNKTKFNVADIISGPIITHVYQKNQLESYLPPGDFSRAVFVLESNRTYEKVAAEYQAQLADPKLTAVDRERIQRDFDAKLQTITKNEYAVNFSRPLTWKTVPEPIARKVTLDVLNEWADFAVNQQHVIAYEVSVLSPEVVAPSALEQQDIVAAIEVLRSKATRVIANIQKIEKLPGAPLARTATGHLSLEEVRVGVDDVMRFHLEPILAIALHSPQLSGDRVSTQRFLESQLAYDQRQLDAAKRLADSTREALVVYEEPDRSSTPSSSGSTNQGRVEQFTPQLSDTFLDRIMSLSGRAVDVQYRQNLIEDYRRAAAATIPLQEAVAYDTAVLEDFHKSGGGNATLDRRTVQAQIEQARGEIAQRIGQMNELFQIVSSNMTPSTQLFTLSGPPTTRTLRSANIPRLGLYGALLMLISLPAIVIGCLLHNRIREEEGLEAELRHERAALT